MENKKMKNPMLNEMEDDNLDHISAGTDASAVSGLGCLSGTEVRICSNCGARVMPGRGPCSRCGAMPADP